MLDMPQIGKKIEPGFHYTFLVGDKPKVLKPTEDLKCDYAYSLHYLVSKTQQLLPVAPDILPYNQDDPKRLEDSLIAGGFFLVDQCGLFLETFNQSIFAYGIRISKEGVLDNQWKEKTIFHENQNDMY
jgi:hypothetical protein